MPIKGLTDQGRFPSIGQLRKGEPKPGGNRPGRDLDYFRFTSEEPGLEDTFREVYGPEPRHLEVFLPYPTTDENFEAYFEEYVQSGLLRRCDGETLLLKREESGEVSMAERVCERSNGCACKENGRLSVILPDLEHFATVTVLTTSKHDIKNLYGALLRYEQVARASNRDLTGIPFTLKRVPRRISTPAANGGRARREKWLLFIEPSPEWVAVQLREARHRALLTDVSSANGDGAAAISGVADQPMLPSGNVEVHGIPAGIPAGMPAGMPAGTSAQARADVSPEGPNYAENMQADLEGAPPAALRELMTAVTDYGFKKENRRLRLNFGSLITGRPLTTFSEVTEGEADRIVRLLDSITDRFPRAIDRIAFAAYCVRQGLSLETTDDLDAALDALYNERQTEPSIT